jgi:hypothetical protein
MPGYVRLYHDGNLIEQQYWTSIPERRNFIKDFQRRTKHSWNLCYIEITFCKHYIERRLIKFNLNKFNDERTTKAA